MVNDDILVDDKLEPIPVNDQPFHIGQSYDRVPATQLRCRDCGGVNFHVATGSHYTALRCPVCLWELCIHDG